MGATVTDASYPLASATVDELQELALYDSHAPDAEKRLGLLRFLLNAGASLAEIRAAVGADGLGALAIEVALRAEEPRSTIEDLAQDIGVEAADILDLLRTIGFGGVEDVTLSTSDAEAIRLFRDISALLGRDTALEIARVTGSALSRVAETVVSAFRVNFHVAERRRGRSSAELAAEYGEIGRMFLPSFARMLDATFRRHLATSLYGAWDVDAEVATSLRELSVGFVDLVGFTSLSASLSPASLASTLRTFETRVATTVASRGARLVKLIGDEAMFVGDPDAVLETTKMLLHDFDDDPLFPRVRIGIAHGNVLAARGDYFGEPVNLAARLVAAADVSTALVSDALRSRTVSDVLEPRSPVELKGFSEPIDVWVLRPARR